MADAVHAGASDAEFDSVLPDVQPGPSGAVLRQLGEAMERVGRVADTIDQIPGQADPKDLNGSIEPATSEIGQIVAALNDQVGRLRHDFGQIGDGTALARAGISETLERLAALTDRIGAWADAQEGVPAARALTARQKELVAATFVEIKPIAPEAGNLFYGRLFELDPTLRHLFTGDMAKQAQKLMQVIGVAVASLDRLDELLPKVRELGRRHKRYGVEPHHYETMGEALLWTLANALGDRVFNGEVARAWTVVYGLLSGAMKDAAAAADDVVPAAAHGSYGFLPADVELVQRSFEQVKPIAAAAGKMFYQRLFELDPATRSLFSGDMDVQARKLTAMIATAVTGLGKPDRIVGAVRDLGRRHMAYGVFDHQYETMGQALLWTLEQCLGNEFTPDVRDAWSSVYTRLAEIMRTAA